MLYGRIIKANDYFHIKTFCPDLTYLEFLPGYGDKFILDIPTYSPDDFKKRFKKSILMASTGYDFDLTNRRNILSLLNREIKVTAKARTYLNSLSDEIEFWNAVLIYKVCGRYEHDTFREKYSIYPLFFNLGGRIDILLAECRKLSEVPPELIFDTILTFLVKMKQIDSLSGISWRYRRDLLDVKARITNVREKVYRYLKSGRDQVDLVAFILSL